jgi:hypothetical protein
MDTHKRAFLHQKQTHNLILAPHQIKRSTNHLHSVPLPEFGGVPMVSSSSDAPSGGRGFAEEDEGYLNDN